MRMAAAVRLQAVSQMQVLLLQWPLFLSSSDPCWQSSVSILAIVTVPALKAL